MDKQNKKITLGSWVGAFMLICSFSLISPASAALFNASYELGAGDVVSFMFDGTVDTGGDTVVVESLLMTPEFNGIAPALGVVSGFLSLVDAANNVIPGDAVISAALLSFSGSTMDFIFFNDFDGGGGGDGFFFSSFAAQYGSGSSYGGIGEFFDVGRWTLAAKIPEPTSLVLFGIGLAGFGFTGRNKRV